MDQDHLWSFDNMGGYYNASRDPRLNSDDRESDQTDHTARKRQRTVSIDEVDVKVVGLTPVDRIPSQDSDVAKPRVPSQDQTTILTLQTRITRLETHISAMHKNSAKLTEEKASMAKERTNYHKRTLDMTQQHAQMVNSLAKRVEEKHKLIMENADLVQENADLVAENAAHVGSLVEKERRVNKLEGEKDDLVRARQRDGLELRNLKSRVDELLAEARRTVERGQTTVPGGRNVDEIQDGGEDRGKQRARSSFSSAEADRVGGRGGERGRPSFCMDESPYKEDDTKAQLRARSSLRGVEYQDKEDKERGRDEALSRYRGPEWERERERDEDGVTSIGGGESYRPSARRDRRRPPSTWSRFPNGIQPPAGPKGDKKK